MKKSMVGFYSNFLVLKYVLHKAFERSLKNFPKNQNVYYGQYQF